MESAEIFSLEDGRTELGE